MDAIKPYTIERNDYCYECNTRKAIEIYNIYNKPIKFSNLLDYGTEDDFKRVMEGNTLSYMKCRKCGKVFPILWENGTPRPLFFINECNNFINRNYIY